MGKYYKWKVFLIIGVVAFSLWKAYPLQEKVNLGLDLQGGMQLVLQVDMEKVPAEAREDVTDRVAEIVRNRIDEFGVLEPVISKQGKDQVVVQLPGVTDRERAKEIVAKTAHLEFKIVSDDANLIERAETGEIPKGYEYKESKEGMGGELLLSKEASLTGEYLTNASVDFDQYGQAVVSLQFDKKGAQIFDQVTFQNVGRQLAIVLDGKVHSAPVIRDRIPNGQAQISGNFTADEASDLALILRAGSLPAPVRIIEERTVGASLGQDSIESGIKAGLVGILFVFLFMPLYYLIAGLVANVGLILYAIVVIGALCAFSATLTLPGIAGFILSIGMAVDANVLIFERIREEIQSGKAARAAVSAGYHRAFSAILDSNVTTLVTSAILFIFGTGPVQGFAVTLSIGIIASMFSALLVTRVIFDWLLSRNPHLNLKMRQFIGVTNIPFLKGRFFAYGFSVLTLVLGIAAFMMRSGENYGVEFTGGTAVRIAFENEVEITQLRNVAVQEGLRGAVIQTYGNPSQNQFIIKSIKQKTEDIENVAQKSSAGDSFQILQVEEIGPAVSADLGRKALLAVFWAMAGILAYLGWRFEWKFALAAVIAVIHDTVFTFGVYAFSGREISLPMVAAILTIMGYSVNDTIVTFDRVRDNLKTVKKATFQQIVELSINQTFARTILTSLTTVLATLALFLFGGSAINDFAFTLLVGFAVGIYSTIFVATSLVVDWSRKPKVVTSN